MKIPVSLGNHHLPTKTAARERVREILWNRPRGSALTGEDSEIVIELAKHHPRAQDKLGVGVSYVSVITVERGAPAREALATCASAMGSGFPGRISAVTVMDMAGLSGGVGG
jgi:hypothetical protein